RQRPAGPGAAVRPALPGGGRSVRLQRRCRPVCGRAGERAVTGLLGGEPRGVTAGVEVLAAALAAQAGGPGGVDRRPPPPDTEAALGTVLADPRRPVANAEAARRMLAAGATLVDVRPAAEVVGLTPGQFCHAGPPIGWRRASGPMRGALIGAVLI